MADVPIALFLSDAGIGLGFLIILFWGLQSGRIFTRKSVEMILKSQSEYIERLERTNARLEDRNDLLESKIDNVIDVARAQGVIAALPRVISERAIE